MKKHSKEESFSVSQTNELDIAACINKMQQQLVSLEKKIDILISKPSEVSFKEKQFSKPFRPFGRSRDHDNRERDNRSRERRFYQVICADCNKECEVPFRPSGDRPVYCKECFTRRKGSDTSSKADNVSRKVVFTQERHFDKHRGGKNREVGQKNKRASSRRKNSA